MPMLISLKQNNIVIKNRPYIIKGRPTSGSTNRNVCPKCVMRCFTLKKNYNIIFVK